MLASPTRPELAWLYCARYPQSPSPFDWYPMEVGVGLSDGRVIGLMGTGSVSGVIGTYSFTWVMGTGSVTGVIDTGY